MTDMHFDIMTPSPEMTNMYFCIMTPGPQMTNMYFDIMTPSPEITTMYLHIMTPSPQLTNMCFDIMTPSPKDQLKYNRFIEIFTVLQNKNLHEQYYINNAWYSPTSVVMSSLTITPMTTACCMQAALPGLSLPQ